jgi:cell division protein FtsZ
MAFEFVKPSLTELKPRIGVVGVGGAGGNAVANMIAAGVEGVDFIVANTDAQALAKSEAATRIQLGLKITQGLGAGARPEIGAAAAEEAMDALEEAIEGYHMLFITAGMGGGTGTGAAPVVARAAREKGILTVGVVTKPFAFEGAKRMRSAEAGIAALQSHVDTLIVIPNQNLFLIANAQTSFKQAFAMADEVLNQGVRSITDLMILPGLINLDFADVRTVMSEMGKAMMGTGEASGERRAIEAAEKAISNPLLDEVSLRGAKAVIVNITGGDDLGLMEVEEAAQHIREMVDPDANIIVGSAFNNDLEGKMRVSVVATGIETAVVAPPVANPASARAGGSLFGKPAAPSTPLWGGAAAAAVPAPVSVTPVVAPEPEPVVEPVAEVEPEPVEMVEEPVIVAAPESVSIGVSDHAPSEEEVLDLDEPLDLTNEVVVATPEPEPAPERPLTLFERMMNLHRKPKAPEPVEDSEANVPPFMRKQRNG